MALIETSIFWALLHCIKGWVKCSDNSNMKAGTQMLYKWIHFCIKGGGWEWSHYKKERRSPSILKVDDADVSVESFFWWGLIPHCFQWEWCEEKKLSLPHPPPALVGEHQKSFESSRGLLSKSHVERMLLSRCRHRLHPLHSLKQLICASERGGWTRVGGVELKLSLGMYCLHVLKWWNCFLLAQTLMRKLSYSIIVTTLQDCEVALFKFIKFIGWSGPGSVAIVKFLPVRRKLDNGR